MILHYLPPPVPNREDGLLTKPPGAFERQQSVGIYSDYGEAYTNQKTRNSSSTTRTTTHNGIVIYPPLKSLAPNMKRGTIKVPPKSISFENIASVNILIKVIKTRIIMIEDDNMALRLKQIKIIHYPTAEECSE